MKLGDKVLKIFNEIEKYRKDGLEILVARKYKELKKINEEYFVIRDTFYWPEDMHEDFTPMDGTISYTFEDLGGGFGVCRAVVELIAGKLEIRTIEVSSYAEPQWKHEKARSTLKGVLDTEYRGRVAC